MLKAIMLAVMFACVSYYYAGHSISEMKRAISIFRDGPQDKPRH